MVDRSEKHAYNRERKNSINSSGQLIRCESGTDSIVWMREDKHVNDKTSEKTFLLHDRTPDDGYIRGFVVFRQQNAHKMCILLYEIFRQTKTRLQSLAFSEKRKGDE